MIDVFKFIERIACKLAGISERDFATAKKDKADDLVCSRLKALASQYPRYGYLMLHGLFKG